MTTSPSIDVYFSRNRLRLNIKQFIYTSSTQIYLKIDVTSPTAVPAEMISKMSNAPALIPS